MAKITAAAILVGALALIPAEALADNLEKQLSMAGQECSQHINALRVKADTWRWIMVAIAAVGGMSASLTGLKASIAPVKTRRRWGYVALVSGALAAISPFLPKAEEFRNRIVLSDRHRIVGLKVQRQLAYLDPKLPFRMEAAKYAMARFTDCIGEEPPQEVPDLPVGTEKIEYDIE
jgi:hypothetical protein